jgi:DNA-binding NtrC family response regulator
MISNHEGKKVRILLVDDDWIDAKAIARTVSAMDPQYVLDTATSVARARAKLVEASYDVAILDYELCDGTGLDLLPDLGDTPAILLTGAGSERIAVKALRLRVTDYLVKDPSRIYLGKLPDMIEGAIARGSGKTHNLRLLNDLLADIVDNAGEALAELSAESPAKAHLERVLRSGQRAAEVCRKMLVPAVVPSEPPPRPPRDA